MVSCVSSLCLVAALAQSSDAAPEKAWLASVPASADVVVRVRGLESGRADLMKMLEGMSKSLADQASPAIDQGMTHFTERFGKPATKTPFLVAFSLPKAGEAGPPPMAVLVQSDDYTAVLKHVAGQGGNAKPEKQAGGYDKVTNAEGQSVFAVKGKGFVAFGTGETLVGEIAKPRKTLDKALSAASRDRLFRGDAGIYVNLQTVQTQYKDQIDQIRESVGAAIEQQGGGQAGGGALAGPAKEMAGKVLDAFKNASDLVLSFDFDAKGLDVAGQVGVKADSNASKVLGGSKAGAADLVASLPAGAGTYLDAIVDEAAFERLQKVLMNAMSGGGEPSAALKKGFDAQRAAGATETAVAVTADEKGARSLQVTKFKNPKEAVTAMSAMLRAVKSIKSDQNMIKDVVIDSQPVTYKGIAFTKAVITQDKEKIAKALKAIPNAPKDAAAKIPDSHTLWYGADGTTYYSVGAPDWDQAKALLDQTLSDRSAGVGQTAGYKSLRSQLPDQVSSLVIFSAQSIVKQLAAQLAPMAGGNVKVPKDLPGEPVFLGGAIRKKADGVEFQLVVPGPVGQVFEKGLGPMLQALQGRVNQ